MAAFVFQDVHQQVMTTTARGHKVLKRIQKIEATLPQFEKAVQEQKSHIHFAYIAGCDWHANIQIGQSQLIFSDLPEFMLDTYEECRDPPPLHILDKFDRAGVGACRKRYSDPSYFRMLMAGSDSVIVEKAKSGMKVQRKKKPRSRGMHGLVGHSTNMSLRGRRCNLISGMLFDDASISDTLSSSGFTAELSHFSLDKRSCCLEARNMPSSMPTELHHGMPATDSETTSKVDCIIYNGNKVTASNYVIQDALHQQNDPLSSSISGDEKAEIIVSTSSKFPDGIIDDRPLDLDLSFVTLETSKGQSGMDDTEMHNQENVLLDTIKMAVPYTAGGQLSEITCQLDQHMDGANVLDFKVQTDFEYYNGKKVISLAHLDYNEMDCENNKSLAGTTPCMAGVNSTIPHEAWTSLKKTFFSVTNGAPCLGLILPITQAVVIDGVLPEDSLSQDSFCASSAKTVSAKEVLCEHQNKQEIESTTDINCLGKVSHCSTENVIASTKFNFLDSETHLASLSSASCPGVIISCSQAVVIDGALPEKSFPQDYFGGTYSKTASEKEVFCERQSKQEIESTDCSNCPEIEYQRSMEKVISASKLDDFDSETHVASLNSASCAGFIFPCTQAVVIDGIPHEESSVNTSAKTASEEEELLERQTKQGTGSMTNSSPPETEYQISMEKVLSASKFDGPNSETHVASCGSSDAYSSPILCGLIISSSVDNINSSIISPDVSSSRSPINIFSPSGDSEDPRGSVSSQLTNKSVILSSDVTAATTTVSQGFLVDSFRKSSINIWTNGGLLGLEPSKPPEVSIPNAFGGDDINDDRSSANSQPRVLDSGNESRKLFFEADKLNLLSFHEQDNIKNKISDNQSDFMLSKQRPRGSIQASSFCKIDNAQNAYLSGTASEIDGLQGKEVGILSSDADIYTKTKPEPIVSRQNNTGMSVGFSSLAHRFLVNSLQRKSPITGFAPLSELMNNDVHKFLGTKIRSKEKERPKLAISSAPLQKFGNKEEKPLSPIFDSSGCQSPPLEHMKVSFPPMNDSDVSKLNLEFFSCQQQGNTLFPSFQLVTESFQPLLDAALESDDDTFCRSCPYSSDDLLSLHSESDSDIWGEDDIDTSYKTEATGSISNSIEFNAFNSCKVSKVNDAENLSFNSGETIDHSDVSFLEISEAVSHM